MRKAALIVFLVVLAALVAGCQKEEESMMTPGRDAEIPMDINTIQEPQSDAKEDAMQEASSGAVVTLSIKNFAFEPAELRVKKGQKATWQNYDSAPHDVTSVSGTEIGSATLSTNDVYEHAFNEIGTFEYYCSIHPRMRAKVIVE